MEQAYKGTSINNISSTIHIMGRLDLSVLQEALCLVLQHDISLRTRITLQDGQPVQYFAEYQPEQFPVYDFSMTQRSGAAHWEAALTHENMPLLDCPLYDFSIFKLGEGDGGVLMKTHHIISDGWSQVHLGNRIAKTYLALLEGKNPELTQSPSYQLHILAEAQYRSSRAFENDRSYWAALLEEGGDPCVIKECKSAALSPVGQRKSYPLSQVLNHSIQSFCDQHRVAPFAVFYMALAIYLSRTNGASRPGIGVPVLNRSTMTDKQTSGMFVSTLPFWCHMDENWTFLEFNEALTEQWYDLLRHQRLPFSDIAALYREKKPEETALFHIVLSYQDSRLFQSKDTSILFTGRWHYSGYQAEHLVIHLSSLEQEHRFSVDYDYLTQLFCQEEIDALHGYLTQLLHEALSCPEKPIWQLCPLGLQERELVLFRFNDTSKPMHCHSLAQQLFRWVQAYPTRVALIQNGQRLRYDKLWDMSCRYAAAFAQALPGGGQIIPLALPKGVDLVAAMLGAVFSGNAWVNLPHSLPRERVLEIMQDSNASLCVAPPGYACFPPNGRLLTPKQIADGEAEGYSPRESNEKNRLCYLVYTSGSTGKPKGVEVGEENLLCFAQGMAPLYGHGGVLSLCSTGFDVFVLESIAALLNGRTIVLCREEEQDNPAAIAALIQEYAVGFFAITPSRLQAYLHNQAFCQALRRVGSIVLGGEHLSGDLVQEIKAHTSAAIYNQYGPSETTIGVSYARVDAAAQISIGKPMENCRLYVLDSHLQPLPIGVYGDLYVGGRYVGKGYHNAPEATAARFLDSPFERNERIYKTGDVACWTPEGTLLLGGRRDSQIKLRGLRIEPEEIATRLCAHPQVEGAAVKLIHDQNREFLAAYYVSPSGLTEVDLLSFAAIYLPSYMIPAYVQRLEALPRTPNGKTDLARLPAPQLQLSGRQPRTQAGRTLLNCFQRVLQREDLDADSDYFLSGGDSLNATQLLCEVEAALGKPLRMADLYALRTVGRLEEKLEGIAGTPLPSQAILPAPNLPAYPLSPSQQSLYLESQLDPTGLAYNMPGAFRLEEHVDLGRLQAAFQALIAREELLRTGIVLIDGQFRQKIVPQADFRIIRIAAPDFAGACSIFVQPFDLSKPPLLRAGLWHSPQGEQVLFVDMHHTIGDGVSTSIFMRRLDALYRGEQPSFPPIFYKDYAYWLACRDSAAIAGQEAYWKQQLEGALRLELPTDFPRPLKPDFQGGSWDFCLSEDMSTRCQGFCAQFRLTPYALFGGAFALLLGKLGGSEDVLLGTPVSGRRSPAVWEVFGPFLNTLPLRLQPKNELTVADYCAQVSQVVADMLDHQEISLEAIISASGLPRQAGGNPLYRILFAYRPISQEDLVLEGKPLHYLPIPAPAAKMDLFLEAAQSGPSFTFHLEYAAALYAPETIALYARCYQAVLEAMLCGPEKTLGRICAIHPQDRLTLYQRPYRKRAPFVDECLDQTIEGLALLLPQQPAVRYHGQTMTYQSLLRRSHALAGQLQQAGVVPGAIVGLCCRRTPDLLAAMLGILAAGCGYLPLLADFPPNRLHFMLQTAEAAFVFCDEDSAGLLPQDLPCPKLVFCPVQEQPSFTPPQGRSSQDVIHVLFTSGSTGQPKGVLLQHRALANLLCGLTPLLESVAGNILCSTHVVFDTFITETLLALALGKCCVMADEEEMMLPYRMAELIQQEGVKGLQLTPSRMQMSLGSPEFVRALQGVTHILMAGEAVTPHLLNTLQQACPCGIFNLYGPAEAAVYVTQGELTHAGRPTIGKALPNCRVYVLDEQGKDFVPPTATGELFLAGECLAAGYCNQPELTEQAFLPDPFFPGERMYKTGDLARLLPNGEIAYVGRRDHQVKLHGQRIELEEISSQVLGAGLAQEAVALAVPAPGGLMSLTLYVVAGEGRTIDVEQIRAHLKAQLPPYMVPSSIAVLEHMPRTASGKIDRLALQNGAAVPQAALPKQAITVLKKEEAPPPPMAQLLPPPQERMAQIWKEALGREEIQPEVSLFEQGGSSLAALTILTQYFAQGWEMTLAQFYDNPTLRGQQSLLFGETPANTAAAVPAAPSTAPQKSGILISGATGFLGAHLVQTWADAGVGPIYCALRGNEGRLWDTLSHYFGEDWVCAHRHQLHPILCDVTRPQWGFDPKQLELLDSQVSTILHAAADVRHYAPQEASLAVNVDGVSHGLALAKDFSARFLQVSTVSIAGDGPRPGNAPTPDFYEQDYDIGQDWAHNIYVKGKFLAEGLVQDARKQGLDAHIFRVGRLVGRSRDGMFQQAPESNAFYSFIQGISALGCAPVQAGELPIELTAVDACAQAIFALRNGTDQVYHVFNPQTIPLREILSALPKPVEMIEDAAFRQRFGQSVTQIPPAACVQLMELWTKLQGPLLAAVPNAHRTQNALAANGFYWPTPQPATLLMHFSANVLGKEDRL